MVVNVDEIQKQFDGDPILKAALHKLILQLKNFEKQMGSVGKKTVIAQINCMPITQQQKDYIMNEMGYLNA